MPKFNNCYIKQQIQCPVLWGKDNGQHTLFYVTVPSLRWCLNGAYNQKWAINTIFLTLEGSAVVTLIEKLTFFFFYKYCNPASVFQWLFPFLTKVLTALFIHGQIIIHITLIVFFSLFMVKCYPLSICVIFLLFLNCLSFILFIVLFLKFTQNYILHRFSVLTFYNKL